MNDDFELKRLKFEDFIWLVFGILCFINIKGDYDERLYIKNKDQKVKKGANLIFETTLTITFLIYLYFFARNYYALKKASAKEKRLYEIKLTGSLFLIIGIICLLYFQKNQKDFEGSPALQKEITPRIFKF